MTEIYKIAYLKNNKIDKLYVFIGNNLKESNEKLQKIFKSDYNNKIFNNIFSKDFSKELRDKNIEIEFLDAMLYSDDSIETIKKKLIKYANLELSFEEIYLFVKQKKQLDTKLIYENINDNGEILREDIVTLYYNIEDINIDLLKTKEIYNFNDLIKLNLDEKELLINTPLGQDFSNKNIYVVNPYYVNDGLIDIYSKKITTTNQDLLMEKGIINDNTIYLCDALDVMEINNNVNIEDILKIYYPFLIENNIKSKDDLLNKKFDLLQITKDKINNKMFERKIENINLFNSIYLNKKKNIEYVDKGIKKIHVILKQDHKINFPLDMIFNLIPATEVVPFIKLNSGSRQEKMYKLYSKNIALNGMKIPFLNKAIIFKLSKTIGKIKQIALYIRDLNKNKLTEIVCEIDNKCNVIIKTEFDKGVTYNYIDNLLIKSINPILEILKNHLAQSGYNLKLFTSIKSENIEIVNIDYELKININKKFNLKKNIGCLSSVFNIINDDINNNIVLRYIRVSNYNEMDNKEIFVLDMLKNDYNINEIVDEYSSNFNVEIKDANDEIKNIIDSFELLESSNRKIKIKNNPGFSIIMTKGKYDSKVNILINGINNVNYIDNIFIYLEALLIITQFPELSNTLNNSNYKKLCNKEKINIEEKIEEVNIVNEDDFSLSSEDDFSLMSEDESSLISEDESSLISNKEEGSLTKGGNTPETNEMEIDLTGKKLRTSKGNLFFDKLNELEPTLYIDKKKKELEPTLYVTKINNKKFKQYSRICPWSDRRQPIILTDDEVKKIEKESPGSYQEIIKFGSDPNKKYSYICPRYWDLKRNISLTEEQVNSGKYGNVIPQDAKVIPKNANIFEFKSKKHVDVNGKYINYVPGFLERDKHPENRCMACCFHNIKWNQSSQIERRKICLEDIQEQKKSKAKKNIDYVMSSNSFPLDKGKYGFLPIQIHNFLQIQDNKCQINYDNKFITNTKCLLRYGVEFSENQSFIATISEYWSIANNKKKTISITKMKEKLLDALNIDNFITLQNGNLIQIFDIETEVNFLISDYKDTKLYKNTDLKNPNQLSLLKKVISSFNNFKNYINSDTNLIDYNYLWDLICYPNDKLFKNGLNIVIIEFADNDVTNNIQIICPSNHYSNNLFDEKKNTILILKNENIYEPIIQRFDKEENNTLITIKNNFFNEDNSINNIKEFLKIVKSTFKNKCKTKKLKIYNFKKNIILRELLDNLKEINFKEFKQLINYNGKVIGLLVKNNNNFCLIPCLPSAVMDDLEYMYIDE